MKNNSPGFVKLDGFECQRCGHRWFSTKFNYDNPPVACSKCKSAYWNKKK